MKKIALYPGSFNPWHQGHEDILTKALKVFDEVVVCVMVNPDKSPGEDLRLLEQAEGRPIRVAVHAGLLVDAVKEFGATAVIRGLRNGHDLQYEMNLQYWNEDLGLKTPIVYFVTDRSLSHVSSSAIRSLRQFRKVGANA